MAKGKIETLGIMLDMSRNAVMTPDALKRLFPLLKKMGYNMVMLYTEDTYEVEGEPYFGYMRGRYTKEELKDLDENAKTYGIELIPCIQTLAHMNAFLRWKKVNVDYDDILLTDDDRTYELIEHMFSSLAECFTSRRVHIGMDEAHMLGRGKHMDLHGQESTSAIMKRHLGKVCEIAKKYGFSPMMWSDMFFYSWTGGKYYVPESKIPQDVIDSVPEGLDTVFWDYYHQDEAIYDAMIKNHQQFPGECWFAGGLYRWNGIAPYNAKTLDSMIPAIRACRKNHVKNVFMTMWGDCGGECSTFSLLPALCYLGEYAHGNEDEEKIKAKFRRIVGIDFDEFVKIDLPNEIVPSDKFVNPSRYMFFSDYFNGFLDSTVEHKGGSTFAKDAEILHAIAKKSRTWGYLFECEAKLCEVLAIKYDLGLRTRKLYQAGDRNGIRALAKNEYAKLEKLLPSFYEAFKKQWFKENKPCGFDVQDFRIGGLILRTTACRQRLLAWADGKIDAIPELAEELLPFKHYEPGSPVTVNGYRDMCTANVFS